MDFDGAVLDVAPVSSMHAAGSMLEAHRVQKNLTLQEAASLNISQVDTEVALLQVTLPASQTHSNFAICVRHGAEPYHLVADYDVAGVDGLCDGDISPLVVGVANNVTLCGPNLAQAAGFSDTVFAWVANAALCSSTWLLGKVSVPK